MDLEVLHEVVTPTKVLSTGGDDTFISYRITLDAGLDVTKMGLDERFSWVCIDRICRLRCSPLRKHFPHPRTSHRNILVFDDGPPVSSSVSASVGTLRPRLFLMRLGTGTGGSLFL